MESQYSRNQIENLLDNVNIVPTLSAIPTTSTKTWLYPINPQPDEQQITRNFYVGQMVRVEDSSIAEGYQFYMLVNIDASDNYIWRALF